MSESSYLHGFSAEEQSRLLRQAEFLADYVFDQVDFSNCQHLLEIGSGVGAQTLQLLKRYPHLKITCIELSEKQILAARQNLQEPLAQGQVKLIQSGAEKIPLPDQIFDGVFICWLLEHVPNPELVLREARRLLKPNGVIAIREVFNTLFFSESVILQQKWSEFNSKQIKMGGDPYVGVRIPGLMHALGFLQIQEQFVTKLLDHRDPIRLKSHLLYWRDLFLSAYPDQPAERQIVSQEFEALLGNPRALMFIGYMACQART